LFLVEKCIYHVCVLVRQIASAENDIAKTMLETEQVHSQVNSLEKKKSELEAEMHAKDDIVAKSQAEIKRRNVEIKRKQDQLQQLSSELDKLISMAGGAELGPLEIQINSLQKSIDAANATITELQHTWLRDQSELVSCNPAPLPAPRAVPDKHFSGGGVDRIICIFLV